MKLVTSILIAGIFALFGLLKFQGYFNIGVINPLEINKLFELNLSFIKNTLDYIFYFPDLIFEIHKEYIKEFFSQNITLSDQDTYVLVNFVFHFLFAFILIQILRLFPGHKDRKYMTIGTIILYLLIIYFVQYMKSKFLIFAKY